jgi:hypothetical protein
MAKIGSDVIGMVNLRAQPGRMEEKTYFVKTEARHGIQGHIVVSTKHKEGENELEIKGTMKQVIKRANAYLAKKGKTPVSSVEIEGTKMLFSSEIWTM